MINYNININGLFGLSAEDRQKWEQEHLNLLYGYDQYDKDRYYRNELFRLLFAPDSSTVDINNPEQVAAFNQKADEYNNMFNSLTPEQRDQQVFNFAFNQRFGLDSRYDQLSLLHPDVQREIYNDKSFKPDSEGYIPTEEEDTRSWYRKLWDTVIAERANNPFHFEAFGNNWHYDYIIPGYSVMGGISRGGGEGAVSGGIVGAVLGFAIGGGVGGALGATFGSEIGSFGLLNVTKTYDESHEERVLAGAQNKSNKLYLESVLDLVNQYIVDDENRRNYDSNYLESWNEIWNTLTEDNPLWQTFKDSEVANKLSDSEKRRLIFTSLALALLGNPELATVVFNNQLNDKLSELLGVSLWRTMINGVYPKMAALFGEVLVSLDHMFCTIGEWCTLEGSGANNWFKALNKNYINGLDSEGRPLPFFLSARYWDGVDKYGTFDPNDILDIMYGTNTKEYKEFIESGLGTREDWIAMQEKTGDYRGWGISPYKRIRSLESESSFFNVDGFLDAYEMSGYIGGQIGTSFLLDRGLRLAGKFIGNPIRKGAVRLTKLAGKSPEARFTFARNITTWGERFKGLSVLAGSSVPISWGYGLSTYDEVRNDGLEVINATIEDELDKDDTYKALLKLLEGEWGLEIQELQQQGATDAEIYAANMRYLQKIQDFKLNQIRSKYNDPDKLKELALLNEAAESAFTTDFYIELLRNVGVKMAFEGWLYRDATKSVIGKKPIRTKYNPDRPKYGFNPNKPVSIPAAEAEEAISISKPSRLPEFITKRADAIGRSIEKQKLNFRKYVENPDGTIVRNTSWLRKLLDYTKEPAKAVWGGFYSNYMDDVTVGFAYGYGMNDFNDYMAHKYNLPGYEEMESGLVASLLAGVNEGVHRAFNEQSFKDGFIGALGTLVSFNPIMGAATRMLKGNKDSTGAKKSKLESWATVTNNPILKSLSMVREENRNKDRVLDAINGVIRKKGKQLTSTNNVLSWMIDNNIAKEFGTTLDIKDTNLGLIFSVIETLDEISLVSEGHSQLYRNFMLELQDRADGYITDADVRAFLNSKEEVAAAIAPEKSSLSTDFNLEYIDNVRNLMQKRAKQFFEIHDNYLKYKDLVKGSLGNLSELNEVTSLLAYSLTMNKLWKERLAEVNKELTGVTTHNTHSDVRAEYRNKKYTEKRLLDLEEEQNTLKEKILELEKKELTYKKHKYKFTGKAKDTINNTVNEYLEHLKRKYTIKSYNYKLDKLKKKIEEIQKIKDRFDLYENLLQETENTLNGRNQDEALLDIITAEEIMALNPLQRAALINDTKDFSKEQLEEVSKLLLEKEREDPNFKEKIRDAAILYNRSINTDSLIDNMLKDPMAFQQYAKSVITQTALANLLHSLQDSLERLKKLDPLMPFLRTKYDSLKAGTVESTLNKLLDINPDLDLNSIPEVMAAFDLAHLQGALEDVLSSHNNATMDATEVRDIILNIILRKNEHKVDVDNKTQDVLMPTQDNNTSETIQDSANIDILNSNNPVLSLQLDLPTLDINADNQRHSQNQSNDLSLNQHLEQQSPLFNNKPSRFEVANLNSIKYTKEVAKNLLGIEFGVHDTDEHVNSKVTKVLETLAAYKNNLLTEEQTKELLKNIVGESNADTIISNLDNITKTFLYDNLSGRTREEHIRILSDLLSYFNDIFHELIDSGQIDLYNPYILRDSTLVKVIREALSAIIGSNVNDPISKLNSNLDAIKLLSNRPNAYYYIPQTWYTNWENTIKPDTDLKASAMPLVVIVSVEEAKSKGANITADVTIDGKEYAIIGVAPVSVYSNEWLAANHSRMGLARTEAIRRAAINPDGTVKTNTILTFNGKPILSSIVGIKEHYPQTINDNDVSELTTIDAIAASKLGYSPYDSNNIFSGEEATRDSNLYSNFRKKFLSSLKAIKSSTRLYLVYPFIHNGKQRFQQIFITPIKNSILKIPVDGSYTCLSIIDCITKYRNNTSFLANYLLNKDSGASILRRLADNFRNGFISYTENLLEQPDENGYLHGLGNALTLKVSYIINNTIKGGLEKTWRLSAKLGESKEHTTPLYINFVKESIDGLLRIEEQILVIDLRNNFDTSYNNPYAEATQNLQNEDLMTLIAGILIDNNGNFRGDNIKGFNWNVNITLMSEYGEAIKRQEEKYDYTGNEELRTKDIVTIKVANEMFDSGILSMTQDELAGKSAVVSAPLDQSALSKPLPAPTPAETRLHQDSAHVNPTPEPKPIIDTKKEESKSLIDTILDYSKRKVYAVRKWFFTERLKKYLVEKEIGLYNQQSETLSAFDSISGRVVQGSEYYLNTNLDNAIKLEFKGEEGKEIPISTNLAHNIGLSSAININEPKIQSVTIGYDGNIKSIKLVDKESSYEIKLSEDSHINFANDLLSKYFPVLYQSNLFHSTGYNTIKNILSTTLIVSKVFNTDFSEDNPYFLVSSTLGTEMDSFVRDYFLKDKDGKRIYSAEDIIKKTYPHISTECKKALIRDLRNFETLLSERGELIYTEEIVVDGNIKIKLKDGKIIDKPVTGHLDMLTVDREGNFRIYDMKTFRNNNNFYNKLFNNYALQLNIYKNLLLDLYPNAKIVSINIIPIEIKYPTPDADHSYTLENGKLYFDGTEVELTDLDVFISHLLDFESILDNLINGDMELQTEAINILKSAGFSKEDIESFKENPRKLLNRKEYSPIRNFLDLTHMMLNTVLIDLSNMSREQLEILNNESDESQLRDAIDTSDASKMEVPAPRQSPSRLNSNNPTVRNMENTERNIEDTGAVPGSENIRSEEEAKKTDKEIKCDVHHNRTVNSKSKGSGSTKARGKRKL